MHEFNFITPDNYRIVLTISLCLHIHSLYYSLFLLVHLFYHVTLFVCVCVCVCLLLHGFQEENYFVFQNISLFLFLLLPYFNIIVFMYTILDSNCSLDQFWQFKLDTVLLSIFFSVQISVSLIIPLFKIVCFFLKVLVFDSLAFCL